MKINKIILNNIRSYKNQEIEFPNGSVLLSGDVGSGKSSILLALDFALFGLRSGSLPGGSLLRKGESKGFVELLFELGDKSVLIRRNLKKQGDSIVQDSGFIEVNGERENLSPIEIKDRVLTLLKYPKDLLTKSKSLIYRYTVYTPQEEMKNILLGDKDYRLETLRKVFGIDKYKRIKNNTIIYVNHLKGIRKELAGKIADLDEKTAVKNETENSLKEIRDILNKVDEKIKDYKKLVENKDKEISLVEDKIEMLKELEKQIEVLNVEAKNKSLTKEKNSEDLVDVQNRIRGLEKEIKNEIIVDDFEIKKYREKIAELEGKIYERNAKLGGIKNRIVNSEEITKNISRLDVCPLCKQQVTKDHIKKVISDENEKIQENETLMKIVEKEIGGFGNEIKILKKELENLEEKKSLVEAYKLKKKNLEEKKEFLDRLRKDNFEIEGELFNLKRNLDELSGKVKEASKAKEEYELLINERDKLNAEYMKLEVEKGGREAEARSLERRMAEIELEIKNKEKSKNELIYWTKVQDWLVDYFVELMEVIEKKILLKVHHDFDSLFQHWFNILIDNELIKIGLDEEFTPAIEQNGHTIEYNYLSGGEKTAAALAYRLALNQVINLLIGVIETKNLIILDEPTDGFSDSQLDRMRDVLRELNVKQAIMVSHESKVESFVDNVIRINKREHVSEVLR